MNFSGKVVIVTDGASGIGRTTSLEFLNRDANVPLHDRSDDAGQKLAREATGAVAPVV